MRAAHLAGLVFSIVAGGAALSGPALAFPDYVKKACKADFKKFCPSYDVNSKQLRACMRAVATNLNPRCVEALDRAGERR